jgi:hypothetical protein
LKIVVWYNSMTSVIAAEDIVLTVPVELLKPWIKYMADQITPANDTLYMVYNPTCINWKLTSKADFILKTISPNYNLTMSCGDDYPTGRNDPALYKMLKICHQLDIRDIAQNADGSFSNLSYVENYTEKAKHVFVEIEFRDGRVCEVPRVYVGNYKIAQIVNILEAQEISQCDELYKKISAICKAEI